MTQPTSDAFGAAETDLDRFGPRALVDALVDITHAQLDAAISLNGEELARKNAERSDVLFALQIALQELPLEERRVVVKPLLALRAIEDRLARVAQTVVSTLDKVIPRPESPQPNTYGRTGRMG